MLIALLAMLASPQPGAATPPKPALPEGRALHEAVAARSDAFFTLYHDQCDPERLRTMLAPDFEMYHDQNGVSANSADGFVERYAKRCRDRGKPGANRLRRVLRRETLKIHPVPGYGAIEEGMHDYYGSVGGRPERKVTQARYLGLWALTPDGWRLARAFSYDHVDAPRLPPIGPARPEGSKTE